MKTKARIALRTVTYFVVALGALASAILLAFFIFDFLDNINKWILPVVVGAFLLVCCLGAAYGEELNKEKKDENKS